MMDSRSILRWMLACLAAPFAFGCAGSMRGDGALPADPSERVARLCDAGQGWACTRVGYEHDMAGEYEDAARAYRRGCELGSTWGCDELGGLYESGAGIADSRLSAFSLYSRACAGGFVVGCYHSGRAMIELDEQAALRDLERACDGHVAQACGLRARTMIAADPDGDVASLVDQVHAACRGGDSPSCEWLARELGATESAEALLDSLESRALRACSSGSATRCSRFLYSTYDEFREARGSRRVASSNELSLGSPQLAMNYLYMCTATEWAEWDYDADGNYAHTCDAVLLEIVRATDVAAATEAFGAMRTTLDRMCDERNLPRACGLAGALGVRGIGGAGGESVSLARLGVACGSWSGGCAAIAFAYDRGVGTPENAGLATILWGRACSAEIEGACERGGELADSAQVSEAVRRDFHASRCVSSEDVEECARGCELGDGSSCVRLGHRHYDLGVEVSAETLRVAHRHFVAECERGAWGASTACTYAASALLSPESPLHDETAAHLLLEGVCERDDSGTPIAACDAYAREELRTHRDDSTRRRMLEITDPVCSRYGACDVYEELASALCASNPVAACETYAARHFGDARRTVAIAIARTLCDGGEEDACATYLDAFESDLPDATEQAAFVRIASEYVDEYEDCDTVRVLAEVLRAMPARQRPAGRLEDLSEILEEYCGY